MKFLYIILFVDIFLFNSIICVVKPENQSILVKPMIENSNSNKNLVSSENKNPNQEIIQSGEDNIQPYFLKKTELDFTNYIRAVQKTPSIKILSIDTNISIKKDKTEGEVFEKVKFLLKDGTFDSIIRKISLGGTSDRLYAFKLASSDVILNEAKVINTCMEPHSMYEHPYICVISKFDPIDATVSAKEILIEYEYITDNLLRRREKPFSTKEQENVIVWIYDNYKKENSIDLINLSIKFENKIDLNKIVAYPEKFLLKTISNKDLTINWSIRDLKENSFKNFALNIPIFNESCKTMNEVHLEITTYSVIQFFIWLIISISIIIVISYVYISKKEEKFDLDKSYKEDLSKEKDNCSISNLLKNSNSIDNNKFNYK